MDESLKDLIKVCIKYYYKANYSWYKTTFNKNIILDNKNISEYNNKFYNNNKEKTELLGIYNKNNYIFSWAYILPKKFNNNNIIIKKLFDWAYSKDNNNIQDFFLKKIFLNSNTIIKIKEQIDLLICISWYVLSNQIENIISIENNNIIKYYIIKK